MDTNRPKHGRHHEKCPSATDRKEPLYGVYTEALQDMTAVLKGSAAKGQTFTASPSIEEFCGQRRRKLKPTARAEKPTTSTMEVSDSKLQLQSEGPSRKNLHHI
jgi:hypothetical protein